MTVKRGVVSASMSTTTTPTGTNSTTVIFIYTAEFILTPPGKPNVHPGVRISLGKFKFSLKYLHPPIHSVFSVDLGNSTLYTPCYTK